MQITDAIVTRASIKVFSDEPVPRAIIESCLDMAVWAPNHHLTEPWRFTVIADGARHLLVEAITAQAQGLSGLDWAKMEAKILKERKKIFSAPTIIAVYSEVGKDAKTGKENLCATAAAVQNLLLAAHHLGYGAIWRTSDIYDYPTVRQLLKVSESAIPVAAVYMGTSTQRQVRRQRKPAATYTTWIDSAASVDDKASPVQSNRHS